MAKILDSSTISQPVYKMIELRKGFLINGQYYLKENMQPVPFNTVTHADANFTDGSRSLLALNRMVKYYGNCHYGINNDSTDSLCFDSTDETITYALIQANAFKYICKFKEENNTCQLANITLVLNNAYGRAMSIYEKGDEIRCSIGGSAVVSIIYRYSKSTLTALGSYAPDTLTASTAYEFDQYCEIYHDDTGYFSYKSGLTNNAYSFMNDSTGAKVSVNMSDLDPCYGTNANVKNRFNYNNLYRKTDDTMSVIHLAMQKAAAGKVNFKAGYIVEYNKVSNDFTRTEVPIQVNPEVTAKYPDGVYLVSEYWTSDVWYKTINGKEYTILYLRDSYNAGKACRAYFFEHKLLEGKVNLYLDKIQELPVGQNGLIIHYKDEAKLRFYGSRRTAVNGLFNNLYCYELDEAKLEFVKTFNLDGDIKEFGFDVDRNLYVLWSNNEVSRFNERTASNFNADFESGLYEYQGEDILTNLIISTTNIEGKFIAKEVTLDMKGNAKFTSTGTKTITVTTSDLEATKVPITITGSGALSIFPKVKM